MSAGFSTGITSLRNVTMSGSCFSKMRRVNKWWLDLEIHVALPFFPKKLNKFKNGTRSILRSSFAGAPKKLRELRGQGHMQHGALMKLGLFGKQLCLFCFQLFAIYVSVCEKPQLIEDSLSQCPLIVQMHST